MPTYDKPGHQNTLDSNEDLRRLTGISESDEQAMEDRAQLSSQEAAGDTIGNGYKPEKSSKPSEVKDSESSSDAPNDKLGDGFTGKPSRKKRMKHAVARRTAGGIIGVGSILGLLGLGGIASGPLAIINAASKLTPNFATVEDQSNNMSTRAMVYAMLGKANKGRLGLVNSARANSYEAKMLKNTGLKPVYNAGGTNRFVGFEVVDGDLAKSSGVLNELDPDGSRTAMNTSDTFVDGDGNSRNGSTLIRYDTESMGNRRSIIRTVGKATGTNGISKFMLNRLSIKRAGIKWSVFSKLKEAADNKTKSVRDRQKEEMQRAVTDGTEPSTKPTTATDPRAAPDTLPDENSVEAAKEGNEAIKEANSKTDTPSESRSKFKAKLTPTNAALGSAALVGALCSVRSISDGYAGYVQNTQILPLMRLAGLILAAAGQIMAGENLNAIEVGAFAGTLHDKNAPVGQQDFSDNVITRQQEGKTGGAPVPGEAVVENQKPVVLRITDSVFSFGYANPLNWACDIITEAGEAPVIKQVGEVVNGAINIGLGVFGTSIEQIIEQLYIFVGGPKALTALTAGSLGAASNVGAHILATDQTTSMGGVALSKSAYMEINKSALNEIAYENSQKSFFDRYLNPYNTRSLASAVVQDSPKTVANIAGMFKGAPKAMSTSIASIFTPNVNAAAMTYEYSTPYRGFTAAEMADPAFFDPNLNETAFADPSVLETYNKIYGKCFGSTIDPATGALITGEATNFLDDKGAASPDCTDSGPLLTDKDKDGNTVYERSALLRYRFYLAYAVSTHSAACLDGAEASCSSMNAGDTTPEAGPQSVNSTVVTAGFPLATTKQIMQEQNGTCFNDSTKEMCKGGHPYDAYDVMAPSGTSVTSLLAGKVVSISEDKCPGRLVSIYSPEQNVTISYLHMSMSDSIVTNGATVKAGQEIGHVGSSGEGCGSAHLHIDAAEGEGRPGCRREDCPVANQVIFIAGNNKIGLGRSLYENYLKLP